MLLSSAVAGEWDGEALEWKENDNYKARKWMMQTDWKERWWKELKYGVRGEEKALRGSVEKQFGAQIKLILNVQELEFDSGIHRNMDFCQAPNILDMK